MNLLEYCTNLNATLVQLEAARRGVQDVQAIDQRTQQWNEKLSDLLSARQRADWLQVDVSQLASFREKYAYTQQLAQQAAQRLEQSAIETLTEENLWVRLLQTAASSADFLGEQVKSAWTKKVEAMQELSHFQQLRATASPLPENQSLLDEYETQYRLASRLASLEVPKSVSDPETFAQALASCINLAARLKFDAPKDVEEFFRAINAGGASLALVTPTVLKWLADNDHLGRYTVRSSGR